MRLEVVVFGQHTSTDEFLLQGLNEVQQVLRLPTPDIVHLIGRYRQAVFAIALRGGFGHHSYDALHNVTDVSGVAAAVAVVIDLDGVATQQLVGKRKVAHVGTASGTIDREEPQARGGDVVELAVAVGEEFVALLGGGIEGDVVVHTVVHTEGDFLVAAIDAGTAGIDQVLNALVSLIPHLMRNLLRLRVKPAMRGLFAGPFDRLRDRS